MNRGAKRTSANSSTKSWTSGTDEYTVSKGLLDGSDGPATVAKVMQPLAQIVESLHSACDRFLLLNIEFPRSCDRNFNDKLTHAAREEFCLVNKIASVHGGA